MAAYARGFIAEVIDFNGNLYTPFGNRVLTGGARVAEIAEGTKTVEYRKRTPFWESRLEGRKYDVIRFRNGYAANAPEMIVEYRGVKKIQKFGGPQYAIQLGRILELKRWKP